MVHYLILIAFAYISWAFGVFAFAQIVGSIRTKSHYTTLVIWTVLVIVASVLVTVYLSKWVLAYYIGLYIGLLQILAQKNIE